MFGSTHHLLRISGSRQCVKDTLCHKIATTFVDSLVTRDTAFILRIEKKFQPMVKGACMVTVGFANYYNARNCFLLGTENLLVLILWSIGGIKKSTHTKMLAGANVSVWLLYIIRLFSRDNVEHLVRFEFNLVTDKKWQNLQNKILANILAVTVH